MYEMLRPFLFHLDPERAHTWTIRALTLVQKLPPLGALFRRIYAAPAKPVQAFGLNFTNPIGLAAGYDKDGLAWRGLSCLGFGHIEIGTVTLRAQSGNPKPRVFRLPEDRALINRMGFPGKGADFVIQQLASFRPWLSNRRPANFQPSNSLRLPGLVLGVNLGKNKETSLEQAAEDYLALLRVFAPLADYLAINISSPNTVGLRRLQARDALENLLSALQTERLIQTARLDKHVPILIKLAPDLSELELDDALAAILDTDMDGVIAGNTTISRDGLHSDQASEPGGLSGAPLEERSTAMVRRIAALTGGKLPIIGVGGVMGSEDARAKLDAGATLVQVYTGLVYFGPGLIKQIMLGLV